MAVAACHAEASEGGVGRNFPFLTLLTL